MADSPSPMTQGPGARVATPEQDERRDGLHRRFESLVGRARWTLWWEGAWPLLWVPIAIVLAFLTASWLGLWLDASPYGRIAGLGLFTAALALSLWPLVRLRLPGRPKALDRLDRDAGLRHGPARTLDDSLAIGSNDPGTRALWDLHRKRAEAEVSNLRVAVPHPDMPRRDRFALRAAGLLAVVASAFVAGPEVGTRLAAAFDWRNPQAALPTFRVDGWIDPPLYTRTPPLMIDLAGGQQQLRAPVRSTVVIRVAGQGDVRITPGPGLTALPTPESQRADLMEQRFTLDGPAELSVRTGLTSGVTLKVEAIPDRAPEISHAGPPEVNARGTFVLSYRAKDDYGIASAEGVVERGEGFKGRRTLVPAPQIMLAIPSSEEDAPETRSTVDLTNHAWAGARVKLTLLAKDEAGQEGRSETINVTLPQRPFTKPLAKALVEQRRNLVLDPDDRRRVQTALDALLIAPDRYTPQWGVFLGLRTATERLRRARTDDQLVEVADWLWAMALQIEDGDLSEAERDLRAAQDRLREAMDRNAPSEEIQRLMNELRQAMDKFLREFAERMQRQQQDAENQNRQAPDRMISQDDLNRMLQQMEEAMRRGDMAEAQRLLDELRNILENLQTAQPDGRMTDPMSREMNQAMQDLENMAREQQQLRDDTFRDGQNQRMQQGDRNRQRQQQGQRGQQGQRQQGQRGQQGQQGQGQEQAENGEQGQQGGQGLGQRQQALRERLEDLQRRMRGMGMQGEQGLADAEQAMREAEDAIGQGQDGPAVDAQGRALEGLQRGQQGMAQQMQQMMQQGDGTEEAGNQPGQGQPQGRGQASQRDNDPLGRPTRSRDYSDGRVKVPSAGESASERARKILEELRRKMGDPTRPREELDYFDRLLRRN
ncbi:MAG TPA: TIGR02302 family protein [Microvirga sp.]|nr:TIGR02302 family protein [Microvirga sp.]